MDGVKDLVKDWTLEKLASTTCDNKERLLTESESVLGKSLNDLVRWLLCEIQKAVKEGRSEVHGVTRFKSELASQFKEINRQETTTSTWPHYNDADYHVGILRRVEARLPPGMRVADTDRTHKGLRMWCYFSPSAKATDKVDEDPNRFKFTYSWSEAVRDEKKRRVEDEKKQQEQQEQREQQESAKRQKVGVEEVEDGVRVKPEPPEAPGSV